MSKKIKESVPATTIERQLSQIACQRRNYSPWQVTVAMNYAIQASLIILFIALGVAIPNVFFRQMIPA